jgi:hypothetical protein
LYGFSDPSKQHLTSLTSALAIGQLVGAVQILGVFSELAVDWEEPIASFLNFVKLFAFNLDVIKIQCFVQKDDPVSNFIVALLPLPIFMLALGCLTYMMKVAGKKGLSLDRYLNSIGLVSLVVFISITIATLRPLHCVQNPNGTSSMASNPAVVCWETAEHNWLMVLAIIGCLAYPIAILGTIVHVTLRYPHLIGSGRGLVILERYRFLFQRFSPACYFWGVFYLLRNLLISLIPVLFPESAIWQVFFISVCILAALVATSNLLPWRTLLANLSEMAILAGILIFMQVASFLIDADEDVGKQVMTGVLLALVILVITTAVGLLCYTAYRRFVPQKAYCAFLCHHKEAASSLGRYFKMKFGMVLSKAVFLDSDQLEELDLIFDTVRTDTKNLVILHTKMTLTRPWCAGEITTAVTNRIPIVPVSCNDYVPPDERALALLDVIWSEQQKYTLGQYGIELERIKDAFRLLVMQEQAVAGSTHFISPQITLDRFAPMTTQDRVIMQAAERTKTPGMMNFSSEVKVSSAVTSARIVVAGSAQDAESRCTCEVFREMVQAHLKVIVVTAHSPDDAPPHLRTAEYLVVLLSKGLLQDSVFIEVLLTCETMRKAEPMDIVTVLADGYFHFPSPDFYSSLEGQGAEGALVATSFRRMLNILALPLSPAGSIGIMTTQVSEICRRFRRSKEGTEAGTFQVDSRSSSSKSKAKANEEVLPEDDWY